MGHLYTIYDLNQIACGHSPLNRLSDNSISGQKPVKKKVNNVFKSKNNEFEHYLQ